MIALDFGDVVKVHINQFYGIEINDFAVKVASPLDCRITNVTRNWKTIN